LLGIADSTLTSYLRETGTHSRWRWELLRDPDKEPDARDKDTGLFLHELHFLQSRARGDYFAELARTAEARWRTNWVIQQERAERKRVEDERKAAARRLKGADREERIEARRRMMVEAQQAHKEQYPGDVRKAANRAGELYLGSPVPRTLKQCLAIAAREEEVAFASIRSYLAGVGVRALFAENDGEVREPEREEV